MIRNHNISKLVSLIYLPAILLLMLASCATTDNIKDGDTAFKLKKYMVASSLLKTEFDRSGDPFTKRKKAFQIGTCYENTNNTKQAEKWYKEAIDQGYGWEASFKYALMLKKNEKYKAAITAFEGMLKEEPWRRLEIKPEIKACKDALQWIADGSQYSVQNLDVLNSPGADFSPVIFDDRTLVFTSSRSAASGDKQDQWTGDKFYDIFMATSEGINAFTSPINFDGLINEAYNDGAVTFSDDYSEMYLTKCGSDDKNINDYCQIYYSYREPEGGWSQTELVKLFEDSVNCGHPFITKNGKELYFAADDIDSYGGTDIYFVKQTDEGWGAPINLGPGINTIGNEAFPIIDEKGQLFFASDGHAGMGGLDIYSAKKVKNKWSELTNLRSPINSGADDFGLIFGKEKKYLNKDTLAYGYFCSSREGGKGGDDIYGFVLEKKPLPPAKYRLDGVVLEKVLENPNNSQSKVINFRPLQNSSVSITNEDNGEEVNQFILGADGSFSIALDSLTDYKIAASFEPDYFANSAFASTKSNRGRPGTTTVIEVEIVLDKIFEEVEIKLNNIYYDFNSAELREESLPELDILYNLLIENPTLKIELASHTDSRGSNEFNQELSQDRAQSVVVYLISKGIPRNRLQATGYGESKPINKCVDGVDCTEEEYQLNRRTTFSVLSERINLKSTTPKDIRVDPKPGEYINEEEN